MRLMQSPAIVFTHAGLTVHAALTEAGWHGELLDSLGQAFDCFSYTRETFPGAVIGAFAAPGLSFALELAGRMWLHTASFEPADASAALAG